MFARLMPHEGRFFTYFTEHAALILQGAVELRGMLDNIGELEVRAHNIKTIESKADLVTHDTIQLLHQTFITPLDREDIHQLASDLDDVMDAMDGTARRAQIFGLGPSPQGVLRITEVLQRMMAAIGEAVSRLKKGDDVMKYAVAAKQLEEEGDSIYHEALGQLFEKEHDAIELIKWKEIYDNLERTLDQAEDVANVVESITIKHA